MQTESRFGPVSPFFIVHDVLSAVEYYKEKLGFETRYFADEDDPIFAIVGRDSAQIMLKAILPDVSPVPNHTRHEWAPWDAFVYVADPDAYAREIEKRGVIFRRPLSDCEDGLRGFSVADADGYVLFFGRPSDT